MRGGLWAGEIMSWIRVDYRLFCSKTSDNGSWRSALLGEYTLPHLLVLVAEHAVPVMEP